MNLIQIERADRGLLAAIDETMAEAARLSGQWLVCRPGCTQCCMGPFAITQPDAMRLRRGLGAMTQERAARVRLRASEYIAAVARDYPGDPTTGELRDEDALPEWMDDLACPALDPATGLCELYEWRPITCRIFGPATRMADGAVGACELCYVEATEKDMERCAVKFDEEGMERRLIESLTDAGYRGLTIVAYAIVAEHSSAG